MATEIKMGLTAAWIRDHVQDYFPCSGNAKIMGDWVASHVLELVEVPYYETLDRALNATRHRLTPPPMPYMNQSMPFFNKHDESYLRLMGVSL